MRPEFLVLERGNPSKDRRPDSVLIAFARGRGIASRTGAALGCSAAAPYRAFRAGLRVDASLCSGRARLRIELLVAAARRPALHIAVAAARLPALHIALALPPAADLGVG